MTKNPKAKRLIINILIILLLVGGTIAAIQYAKGYRPDLSKRSLKGTGLLNITSYPKSARVVINDKLTTVTDDKLYLVPGNYQIKIEKDGFHPWTKTVPVKSELVSNADARLFPIITATSPLTFYQVTSATANPDGSRIAYVLKNSPIETANGLYVHSFSGSFLVSSTTQITENSVKDYSKATLVWSPDSTQILAIFTEKGKVTKADPRPQDKIVSAELLSTKTMNSTKNLSDVTLRLPQIINEWQAQYAKLNQPTIALFPQYLTNLLTKNAVNVYFSPDKEKVIYTPTTDMNLPENEIGKALPNINSTKEARNLLKNKTYIFDLKEGTNYLLPLASNSAEIQKTIIISQTATPSANINDIKQLKAQTESTYTGNVSWYNSDQIIITDANGVSIADYDGLNVTNITYVQPLSGFVLPTPDGSRLILLTNINQKADTFNLISFDLK